MKTFSERNLVVVGAIGICVTVALVWLTLNFKNLPFVNGGKEYSAYFAEAGGLSAGNIVQVSGCRVGDVSSVSLDGPRVLVKFKVSSKLRLGDRTEAAVKLKTVLGTKLLEVTPRGQGQLAGPIPEERTTPAYELPDALGDLSTTISGLNTDQLSNSLSVLANEFSNTAPDLKVAVKGVARLSQTLDERDKDLRNLLGNAHKVTQVLADRSEEVVGLVNNTNSLLAQLRTQSSSLDQIANNLSAVARQLNGFISENRTALKPALDKLNGVLAIVDNRKERVQKAIKGINNYALSLGEAVASGPFFTAYLANLLPGQFVQPFIDAAFSDLGVDPATRLPSELTDPPTGQPGTPPLPLPYPRTGQGGEPRRTLPDAITGKPGDPRYPLKAEPPAPPPGGPPPGPPALMPPGPGASRPLQPAPAEQPAPGQIPPNQPPALNGPGPLGPPAGSPQPGGGR
jgi:phospholipid/cholesterol/gamma-HCH transport system substrate-binding protein